MFKRSVLSSAIVLAGSVWSSAALATEHAGAQFKDPADINKISEWMGKDVQDNEGNEVGEIADFAVNLEDGSIVYAVVDLSGMFNDQAIAVPLSALAASAENGEEITLQASKSEWKAAETFAGTDWPLKASLGADTSMVVSGVAADTSADESTDTGWQQSENQHQGAEVSSFDRDVRFDALDTDGNGYLSTQEYPGTGGATATDVTDQDQDGRISRTEFAAFEARELEEGGTHEESSADERYGDTDAEQSYESDGTADPASDE
ncbi:MAG: PRC-barrel domain-containing protein [Pseudomonadales bacterium]